MSLKFNKSLNTKPCLPSGKDDVPFCSFQVNGGKIVFNYQICGPNENVCLLSVCRGHQTPTLHRFSPPTCSQETSLTNPDGPLTVRDISPLFVFILWLIETSTARKCYIVKIVMQKGPKRMQHFKVVLL